MQKPTKDDHLLREMERVRSESSTHVHILGNKWNNS